MAESIFKLTKKTLKIEQVNLMFQLSEDQEERAKKLHEECLVIDATTLIHAATSERWFNQARSGGVDAIWVTTGGSAGISGTIRAVANVLRFIESHSDVAVQVRTTEEMRKAKKEGKKTSLVSSSRPNIFKTKLANIAPGEMIIVEIQFKDKLIYDKSFPKLFNNLINSKSLPENFRYLLKELRPVLANRYFRAYHSSANNKYFS